MPTRWSHRRSRAERVALPHPVLWSAGALVLLAGAGLVEFRQSGKDGEITLPYDFVVSETGRTAAASALLILALWAARQAAVAWLARRPGPVEVAAFDGPRSLGQDPGASASPDDASVEIERVLATFRRTLSTMSLATPQSIPSTPQPDSMLDDVREAAKEPTNSIATIAALVRAAVEVRSAYRVSGRLHLREGSEPFGITVHVALRTGGPGVIETLWARDWDDLAVRAAHVVGAFVLPRSRLARRAPWRAWHGRVVPHELFHQVQLGATFKTDRRYEEATAALHVALKIDPQNPFLRIELAQVQEQMGLDIDALATYADVIALESWYDRGLWLRLRGVLADDTTGRAPSLLRGSPHGPNAVLIARYRLVSRLVAANELSYQWERAGFPEPRRNHRRARERAALRRRLTVWLESFHRQFAVAHGLDATARFSKVTEDRRLMRYFLRFVGYSEVQHLIKDYRWTAGRRRPGMPATQTALAMMRVWAPIQLQWAGAHVDEAVWVRWAGVDRRPTMSTGPTSDEIARQVDRYLARKPRMLREWQEHYNAACVFAVAIAAGRSSTSDIWHRRDQKTMALMAVRHLEIAVSTSDSGFVGTSAQWLATGDEDLDRLRSTSQFVDFLDRYLPNDRLRIPRPRRLFHLLMSFHTAKLLGEFAQRRAGFWADHSAAHSDELTRERSARGVALRFAGDELDWVTRVELVHASHEFTDRHGLEPVSAAFPQFQDEPAIKGYLWARTALSGEHEPDFDRAFTDAYFQEVINARSDDWSGVHDYLAQWCDSTTGDRSVSDPWTCALFWYDLAQLMVRTAETRFAPSVRISNGGQPLTISHVRLTRMGVPG